MWRSNWIGWFCLLALVSSVNALGVLIPLYIYPGGSCSAWEPVSSAISAYPSLPWYIVLNPDHGPGPTDTLYQSCVSSLPSAQSKSRITLGFVDASQNSSTVIANIDTYASWPASARPTGIFFVEVLEESLTLFSSYVSYARHAGFSFIGMDPGESVNSSYTSLADLVNTYESDFAAFSSSSISNGTPSRQSAILVNAPSTGSYASMISELRSMDLAAVYINDHSDASQALPSQLLEWVGEIAAVDGTTQVEINGRSREIVLIAAIVGGVLGGLLAVGLFFWLWRRRRRSRATPRPEPPESIAPFTVAFQSPPDIRIAEKVPGAYRGHTMSGSDSDFKTAPLASSYPERSIHGSQALEPLRHPSMPPPTYSA
ncbi:hypothetical protein HMN09_01199300 [Mycena chlorophos]|uniref:Uncharacterized protein n=1 Tax=Mycena chlorophos TaxID=658473 RepID=A0A8H6S6C1_MYCCL|nr:hypothetical protein HMN09_01199300 [Mycena chlorophos]